MFTTMRRILAMLLAVITLLTAAPFAAAAEELFQDVVVAVQDFEEDPAAGEESADAEAEEEPEDSIPDEMDVVFKEIAPLPEADDDAAVEEEPVLGEMDTVYDELTQLPEEEDGDAESMEPGLEFVPVEILPEEGEDAASADGGLNAGYEAADVMSNATEEISLGVSFGATAHTSYTQDFEIYISRSARYLLTVTSSKALNIGIFNGSEFVDGVSNIHSKRAQNKNWCVDLEGGKTYTIKVNVDKENASGYVDFSAVLRMYIDGSYVDRATSLAYGKAESFNIQYSNDFQIYCFTAVQGKKYNISSTGSVYRLIEVRDENFDLVTTSSRDIYGSNSFTATLTPGDVYYIVVHGRDYEYYYSATNYSFWYKTGSGTISVKCTDASTQQIAFTMNRSGVAPGFGASVKFNVTSAYAEKVRVLADGKFVGQEHDVVNGCASFYQSFHVSGTRSIQIEGYYNGKWSLRSSAQTLSVYSRPALGTPEFTSIIDDYGEATANRDYTLEWAKLSGAVAYSVYVYSGFEEIYKQETEETRVTIPAHVFATPGVYSVDVYGLADVGQQSNPSARATILVVSCGLQISGEDTVTVGKSTTLTVHDADGVKISNKKLDWESSNPSVASVSAAGVVKGKKTGYATIIATDAEGSSDSFEIRVTPKPTSVFICNEGGSELNPKVTYLLDMAKYPTIQLYAEVLPADADDSVTWKSSSTKIATVAEDGTVTFIQEGNVSITATTKDKSKRATIKYKVQDSNKPTGITLNDSGTITISKGQNYVLGYKLQPTNAKATLTWTSSNKKVATVDAYGNVIGVKEGTATITVKTHNGKKDTVKVKVVDPYKPEGITLNDSGTVIVTRNKSVKLGYTLKPVTARADLTWTSSNKKVATVDAYGNVTGVKEGTATITVKTHNGKKDTVKVQVVDPYKPAAVEMQESGTLTMRMKDTLQLHASVLPATADQKITWKSSSTKCATVNANGLVTAIKSGTVTITAEASNGKKDTVKIKITDYYPVEALDLTYDGQTYANMYVGGSLKLNVTYTPAKSKNFANLTWSSSNRNVVTVDADGTLHAVGKGDAVITVKDTVTGKYDTFGVVVTRQPTYRAMVTVENTVANIRGYKRVYKRASDRDGFKKILSQQNFDGKKFEQIADLSNLSKTTLMNQIQSLPKQWGVCEDDITYFFFGGHGSPSGQLFLYANGAENQYINPSELKAALDKIPGKVVVIIEACYSGNYVYGRNAAGEDAVSPESFTSAIIDVFSEGDTIPVVMLDDDGNEITLSEENSEFWMQNGVMSNAGELRQSKYRVLTAASHNQSSWSAYSIDRNYNIIESKAFGLFSRAVCIAGGYDSVTQKTTWKSGEKTLSEVYTSVQKKVNEFRKSIGISDAQSVQVYPANSDFVIFSK